MSEVDEGKQGVERDLHQALHCGLCVTHGDQLIEVCQFCQPMKELRGVKESLALN